MRTSFAIVAVLMVVGAFATEAPGLRVTIEPDLITAYKDEFLPQIVSKVQGLTVPDIKETCYSVEDITLSKFAVPSSDASVQLADGSFTVAAKSFDVSISFVFNLFHFIKSHVTVTTTDTDLSIVITTGFSDNAITFTASDSKVTINDLKVTETGILKHLFKWYADIVFSNDKVKQALSNNIGKSFGSQAQSILDSATANFNYQQVIPGTAYSISLTPLAGLDIQDEYISATLDGTVYVTADGYSRPSIPNDATLPVFDSTENLQVYVAEYVAASGLNSAFTNGDLKFVLTPELIPSDSPIQLDTASMGLLIPALAQAFPNAAPVRLSCLADPAKAPVLQFNENVALDFNYECHIDALNETTNKYQNAAVIAGLVQFVGSFEVQDNQVSGSLSSLNFASISVKSSNIGSINTFLLKFKLNLASIGLVTAVNTVFSAKTFPLPSIPGYTISDADLTFENGYASFAANTSPN